MEEEQRLVESAIAANKGLPGEAQQPISKVVQLFRTVDPRIRSRAARLVGRYNSYETFLHQRLLDENDRVRANVVESLWGINTPSVVAILKTVLKDRNHRVRTNAIVGMHLLGNPDAISLLVAQSQHASASFRASAAWAMGEIKDPSFVELLAAMEQDAEPEVSANAKRALARFNEQSTLPSN